MIPQQQEKSPVTDQTINEAPTTNLPATRVADRTPVALAQPLADLDQAWRVATALGQAYIVPKDLRGKPADILAILMYGRELGFNPMQSIQGIYIVNGRPQLSGQTWITKVREAGHRLFIPCRKCDRPAEQHRPDDKDAHRYEADHTAQRCRVTIMRGDTGEQHSETFTMDDAKTAKLSGKDTYQQHPRRMLLWRAVSNCATIICPEVALGFGAEEPEALPDPAASLASAVDARAQAAEPAVIRDMSTGKGYDAGTGEPVDAEIVDDSAPSETDLAAADEEARQQVLAMASEHQQGSSAKSWPEVAPISGSDG